jgi:hypothetical protein
MTRLEDAAIRLHEILWRNTGSNDDWLINFKCDEAIHDELIYALNELGDAVEEVKPGSKPWPLPNPIARGII